MLTSRISIVALIAALGAAVPALAQDATAPAEAPATEAPATTAPAAPAAPATDLSMGTEAGAATGETKPGDTYTAASFEAWQQRCVKTPQGTDPCQLYMLLKDGEGNSVAELSIFNLPEGTPGPAVAGATFVAPLETLLTANVQLVVDTAKPRVYPFTLCTQVGCVARLGFTAEEIASFKKGAKASFVIVPFVAPDKPVALEASLKGFTAGYEAVLASNKVADAAALEAAKAAGAEVTTAP